MRWVVETVLAFSVDPFHDRLAESEYGPRRAAYDIKKLRAKGMVRKIEKSRRYEPVPDRLRSADPPLVLRREDSPAISAASGQPELTAKPANLLTDPRIAA